MVFESLANGTPASAVPTNIISMASIMLPFRTAFVVPSVDCVRQWRRELPILVETLAAYRLAKAVRVVQSGSDGTEKKQISLLTFGVSVDVANSDGSG